MSLTQWGERPLRSRALAGVIAATLGLLVIGFRSATRPAAVIAGSDVTVYQAYGSKVLAGAMPYRDFRLEYPPGVLPMFVLPATRVLAGGSTEGASWAPVNGAGRRYYRGFTLLVLLLVAAMLVLTALTLQAMRRPARMVLLSLAVVAAAPVLIGQVLTERFDVWPAALTAAAVAAFVRDRYVLAAMMLGLGAAAKFYPALLLPVLVIAVVRQRGVRTAVLTAGAAIAAGAAVFLPFAIASFSGTWASLRIQFSGGLQIETLASSALVLARHVAEHLTALGIPKPSPLTTRGAGGGLIRVDLVGAGVGTAKIVTTVLLVAALCLLWIGAARSRRDAREDLLRYAAATVATVLALGTVLSPQYIAWLIPLVPLVGGRSGTIATVLFVVAAVLTNVWIPGMYLDYQNGLDAGPASLLLARNLALLATAVVLVLPDDSLPRLRVRAVVPRDA